MGDQSERQFPIVYSFDGAPSADGTALLVEATGFDGSVMRFAIPIDNVKHFIGTISATRENGDDAEVAGGSTLPIPATSIAIGEPSGEEGYIGIAVGRAELVFSLPLSSLAPIGRTLLMAATGPQSSVGN